MRRAALLLAFLLACVCAGSAQGSSQPAVPACNGIMAVVRVSDITPSGSMDAFMKAVAAHQAWYSSHNLPDKIFASKILVQDPSSSNWSYSNSTVMTFHVNASNPTTVKHDAAWDDYVKLYNATSHIKETYLTCIPSEAMAAHSM